MRKSNSYNSGCVLTLIRARTAVIMQKFSIYHSKGENMQSRIICSPQDMELILSRLTAQLLEAHPEEKDMLLIGIRRRGADLAARIAKKLECAGRQPYLGSLDINLYRDDWTCLAGKLPSIGRSQIPCSPDGKLILLIDDVLFSGRTIRAALEAVFDFGRPRAVELLVLIDRGHRELPIFANYVGKSVATRRTEHIDVLLAERDGEDAVILKQE